MRNLVKILKIAAIPAALVGASPAVLAGTDAYVGEITLGGFNFCPQNTVEAAGQLQAIASNQALFALYGTTYGGDGVNTFALPDLRGRAAIGSGAMPGGSTINLGQRAGNEQITLSIANLPVHSHVAELRAENAVVADKANPNNATLALAAANIYSKTNAPNPGVQLSRGSVVLGASGGNTAFSSRDPYLGMTLCVNAFGVFPPRS